MNRILVIQTAFLGDVILATPVVSELHRLFPNASIDVLVKKGNESLLANNPKIRDVIAFDKSKGKYKSIFRFIKQFRKEKYDLTVNMHRFGSSGMIAGFSGAKQRIGFDKNPFAWRYTKKYAHQIGNGTHEVERNLLLIQDLGAKTIVRPELFPSKEDFDKVTAFQPENYICIAPASVWFTKALPESKWIELIKKNANKKVYVLGGPDDSALANRILTEIPEANAENLCGKLSLLQSAALMKGAERNYVNDSGPLHLASSMNAKVTAFFCSTVPEFGFGPMSEDSEIKQVDGLGCRPCGLHGHAACPKGHFKCGLDIQV
ncbi:glycosyltransferase family 9 protein [Crocinitomicaceae bacterium]|nr:glycosyltransferase family 9 protein [Crocinitomicaceae bacterium]